MSLISSICCVNCCEIYDDSRKPCLGTCHDCVCQQCRQEMKVFTCPTCGKKDAFKEETINYEGLEIQKAILENLTEQKLHEIFHSEIKQDSGPCSECSAHCGQLRICKTCFLETGILPKSDNQLIVHITDIPVLGYYYKSKKLTICANCALDAHSGHVIAYFRDFHSDRIINSEIFVILTTLLQKKFEKEEEEEDSFLKYMKRCKLDESRRKIVGYFDDYMKNLKR